MKAFLSARPWKRRLSVALFALAACSPSLPGHVYHALSHTAFIRTDERLLGLAEDGVVSVRLDGTDRKVIIAGQSCYWQFGSNRTYLITCDKTLYVLDQGGRRVRRLAHPIVSMNARDISPDGKQLAIVPPTQREVLLIDLDTLSERSLASPKPGRKFTGVEYPDKPGTLQVRWESSNGGPDGSGSSGVITFNLEDGTTTANQRRTRIRLSTLTPEPVTITCTNGNCDCNRQIEADDETVLRITADGHTRALAHVLCRLQGNWEYGPAPKIRNIFQTKDCQTIGFEYDHQIYLIDVTTGQIGKTGLTYIFKPPDE